MKLRSDEELRGRLRLELSACVKCGKCLAACPLYGCRHDETVSMRGKIAMLQALEQGSRIPMERVDQTLNACFGCQTCRDLCPNGVHTDLIRILGRHLFGSHPHNHTHSGMKRTLWTEKWKRFGQKRLLAGDSLMRTGGLALSLMRSLTAGLGHAPVTGKVPLVFIDGLLLPRRAERRDLLQVIAAVSGTFPEELVTDFWGYQLLMAGDLFLLEVHLKQVFHHPATAGDRDILVFSPESLYCLDRLPHLYLFNEAEDALFRRMTDGFSWLEQRLPKVGRPIAGNFCVHDPCLVTRGLGRRKPYRRLLQALFAGALKELKGEGACCGGRADAVDTGPDAVLAVREKRLKHIKALGVDFVVSACWECAENFGFGLAGEKPAVVSLISAMKMALQP